jgi:diaminohydroxyphosphoribosylaminopyrimidine deaminase/5-amino-6-(5-phosphoribosylamino)uracil reductase
MKRVFQLAQKGAGRVSPNPLVGAVIVGDGKIIGEGYHQHYGETHAEVNAINNSIGSPEGSTLYCNLEPCCHLNKQTPPCVPEIISKGIKKVVISNLDPNPDVNGKGVQQLRDAGIEVITGILEEEGADLNRFFFKYIKEKKPWVTLKMAQTLDGFISPAAKVLEWISGQQSQELVHKWRSEYDAVLIGANTLRTDNAELTVRHAQGRDPIRIIMSSSLYFDRNLKIFQNNSPENTWIIATRKSDLQRKKDLEKLGCRVVCLENSSENLISLVDLLTYLADQKISSILVEGGQNITSQFLLDCNFDEMKLFISPKIWGEGLPTFSSVNREFPQLQISGSEGIGEDLLLTLRPQN